MKKQKIINILPYILGMVFIFSGISKLLSIVFFEQFVYSLGYFTLNQAVVCARIIVAAEIILGFSYIFRIYLKQINIITIFLLIVFTLFIALVEISGFSKDCHCFGNFFIISNKVSIIKNLLLIALALFTIKISKHKTTKYKIQKLSIIVIISIATSIAVYFPSNIFSKTTSADYCTDCLNDFAKKESIANQKKIICFFSTSCEYCLLAGKNMKIISQKANNNKDILYVLWRNNKDTKQFLKETNSNDMEHKEMFVLDFINLTKGKMPLIILYDKGKVEHAFHFSDIDEQMIIDFLGKK